MKGILMTNRRFESICEGCGLYTIVEWYGNIEKGLCDKCAVECDNV